MTNRLTVTKAQGAIWRIDILNFRMVADLIFNFLVFLQTALTEKLRIREILQITCQEIPKLMDAAEPTQETIK